VIGGSRLALIIVRAEDGRLSHDAATKSARLTLDTAYGAAHNSYNFDGYANGDLLVTVPTGWKVTVVCTNKSTLLPHSCAIVRKAGDTTPALPGASTPDPTEGLSPNQGHNV